MEDLWTYLKNATKPIVLYGTGNGADKTLRRLGKDGVKVSGVFSSFGFKKGKIYGGFPVSDYDTLKEKLGDMIILVCFGSHLESVMENVKSLTKENELYIPDVPVLGEEIFDIGFARRNKELLEKAYNLLADENSKNVFYNIVMFKLTGKLEYLLKAESSREEVFELLSLNNNESFLDLGAFVGDTVEEFISFSNGYNSIMAVEPDKRNFKKLCENVSGYENVKCINAAVSKIKETVLISANHGRGNSAETKMTEIEALTIANLCNGFKPTFIKMDIEGSEIKAIEGGKQIIKTCSPKLHIACYHTAYDIFKIPLLVNSINPSYKIYIRHHSCFPAWDVNCICIK